MGDYTNWKQEYKAFDRDELIKLARSRFEGVLRIGVLTDNQIREELMTHDRVLWALKGGAS